MSEIKEGMKWVLVDTISQFRMRYLVEIPAQAPSEWALDTVVCEEALEFSQEHLGETIVSHRVLTKEEAIQQFDQDNDYLKEWDEDVKINNSLTRWTQPADSNEDVDMNNVGC